MNSEPYEAQESYQVRCEWGETGVQKLAPICDVLIIVDVLSFSTSVEIATSRGAVVYPYNKRGQPAEEFAESHQAQLATKERSQHGFSLSPTSLLKIPAEMRLVLPSPNGATLSMRSGDTSTVAGCLRNALAVANWAQSQGTSIGVIPAGERWRESRLLRPSLEDSLGAGAIIHALSGDKSPEAMAMEAVFLHFREELPETLSTCVSGRELIARGYAEDVRLAGELNCSQVVPVLHNGSYRASMF